MKFNKLVYGALLSLLSLSAHSIPPAGYNFENALKQSADYKSIVLTLQSTDQEVERVNKDHLSDSELGQCSQIATSRGSSFFIVVFKTSTGDRKFLFGSEGSDKPYQNCTMPE